MLHVQSMIDVRLIDVTKLDQCLADTLAGIFGEFQSFAEFGVGNHLMAK